MDKKNFFIELHERNQGKKREGQKEETLNEEQEEASEVK